MYRRIGCRHITQDWLAELLVQARVLHSACGLFCILCIYREIYMYTSRQISCNSLSQISLYSERLY